MDRQGTWETVQRVWLPNLRVEVPPAQFLVWRRSISHGYRGDLVPASWDVGSHRGRGGSNAPTGPVSQARFPDLRGVSFDRGFHSPDNRVRLDELLDHNVLPKTGYLNKADRERERGDAFVAMRRQHPAVESAINNLEHRGLDRVLAYGAEGFARVVALSVVALNIHRIGLLLRRKARRRRAA